MIAMGVSSTSEKNVRMRAHMSPLRACLSTGGAGAATRVVGVASGDAERDGA